MATTGLKATYEAAPLLVANMSGSTWMLRGVSERAPIAIRSGVTTSGVGGFARGLQTHLEERFAPFVDPHSELRQNVVRSGAPLLLILAEGHPETYRVEGFAAAGAWVSGVGVPEMPVVIFQLGDHGAANHMEERGPGMISLLNLSGGPISLVTKTSARTYPSFGDMPRSVSAFREELRALLPEASDPACDEYRSLPSRRGGLLIPIHPWLGEQWAEEVNEELELWYARANIPALALLALHIVHGEG